MPKKSLDSDTEAGEKKHTFYDPSPVPTWEPEFLARGSFGSFMHPEVNSFSVSPEIRTSVSELKNRTFGGHFDSSSQVSLTSSIYRYLPYMTDTLPKPDSTIIFSLWDAGPST